jgi:hypothetical protein
VELHAVKVELRCELDTRAKFLAEVMPDTFANGFPEL